MYSFSLRFASIFLLGVAISSSRASAWWPSPHPALDAPPKTEPADKPRSIAPPKQDPKAADKPKLSGKAKPGEKLSPKVEPSLKGKGKGKKKDKAKADAARRAAAKKKRKAKAKFVMNPDAKWACDQQTSTLEPVWRGEKTLTFQFSIRNEGTADLLIRAKGG